MKDIKGKIWHSYVLKFGFVCECSVIMKDYCKCEENKNWYWRCVVKKLCTNDLEFIQKNSQKYIYFEYTYMTARYLLLTKKIF